MVCSGTGTGSFATTREGASAPRTSAELTLNQGLIPHKGRDRGVEGTYCIKGERRTRQGQKWIKRKTLVKVPETVKKDERRERREI